MKLSSMIQKHLEAPSEGLKSNFGDSFLLTQIGIFRNVRTKSIRLGFKFSDKPDADYLAFPMGQLENVLGTKIIPYTDNVTALMSLNKKAPNLDWDHVVDNLKPNYVFHESCHAVARTLSQEIKSSNLQDRLTIMLLEESFANTCEFFAIADANDQVTRNFLEVNSYFVAFEDRSNLKKSVEKHGYERLFKFFLLTYLHSNFLNEKLASSDFKKIADLAELKDFESNALKGLAKYCFALNPRFRYSTTEMYLRLNGLQMQVEEALNFEYLNIVKNNSQILKLIESLSHIAGAQK